MAPQWVNPSTITGDAATGDRYFRRQYINDAFWREVAKGNHILFVAPRRVGKTSIMKDLVENHPDGHNCIYQNIEGIKTRNEFYRRLFEILILCINRSATQKVKDLVGSWMKKYSIEEVTKTGIKIKSGELNYETELREMIPELSNTDTHTVIFLDEFAEVINKLNKQGQQQDAVDILHTLREIRSDSNFANFTIVYAGSIGLQFVIKSIDRPKLINDLHPIETGALNAQEAKELIAQLTKGATIQFSNDAMEYMVVKLKHLLPYYIQLMIEEVDMIARQNGTPQITNDIIDQAFEQVLKLNRNFDDWVIRLRDYQEAQFPFINTLLKTCAHKDSISIQEIYNTALDSKYNRSEDYMDYVEELVNDGYIVEYEKGRYRFISPFLQQFWLRKYPVL